VLVKKLGMEGYGTIIGDYDPVWKFVISVKYYLNPASVKFTYNFLILKV